MSDRRSSEMLTVKPMSATALCQEARRRESFPGLQYVQDASPAVKATVVQPDVVRQQKLQIVDGRFVDHRWVNGRWVLSSFANGNGDMDYEAWEKVDVEPNALCCSYMEPS